MAQGMLGAFMEIDSACDAIAALRKNNVGKITVFTPTPRHEFEHALQPPRSPVRMYTLIGALSGATFGYWVSIWGSNYWPLIVGGKAISTWIPYTIFAFELMVLVGGLSTVAGKKVGVLPGTTTEKALNLALSRHSVKPSIVTVKNHAEGVAALDSRAIDAYASDRTILIGMGRTSKDPAKLSLIEEFFSYEPHGFMLKRGDAAFRLSVNRALAAMYRSGEVGPIYEKHFGSMTTAGQLIMAMFLMNGLPE